MELQETPGQHGVGHISRVEGGLGKAGSRSRERKGYRASATSEEDQGRSILVVSIGCSTEQKQITFCLVPVALSEMLYFKNQVSVILLHYRFIQDYD